MVKIDGYKARNAIVLGHLGGVCLGMGLGTINLIWLIPGLPLLYLSYTEFDKSFS